MSAHKHTPGPWKVGQPYGCSIYDNNGKRVAKCFEVWTSPLRPLTECKANGRLISAAPDSHEANVMFVEAMDRFCGIEPDWDDDRIYDELPSSELARAYFSARAAIAKATGEPA